MVIACICAMQADSNRPVVQTAREAVPQLTNASQVKDATESVYHQQCFGQ